MRVLVTGVSGAIGGAVARSLLERGHEVVGVVREAGRPAPEGVRPLVADLFAPGALAGAAAEADGAVHAASSNDERSGELDGAVVATLVDAFAGTDRPLVYTSGLWLHGNSGDGVITEDSPFDPPMMLGWRPAVETSVEAAAARGVRSVRIRPGLVYGHGKGYVPMVLAPRGEGASAVVRHFGDGANRWSVVHLDDLGDLYALALESAPAGSVYLGAVDESVEVADAARAVAERAGAAVRAWDPADAAQHWGVMVEPFLLDQVATSAKARKELGWEPRARSLLDELGR